MVKELMKARSMTGWQKFAEKKVNRILQAARGFSSLGRRGPRFQWKVEVQLVGKAVMTRLNQDYRGKQYPTDVLSFPNLAPFREAGLLGELVICLPVLKSQAKTLCHSPELELEVLLTHGILHLLGLDHEKSVRDAAAMARWEARILKSAFSKSALSTSSRKEPLLGLIERTKSGIKSR